MKFLCIIGYSCNLWLIQVLTPKNIDFVYIHNCWLIWIVRDSYTYFVAHTGSHTGRHRLCVQTQSVTHKHSSWLVRIVRGSHSRLRWKKLILYTYIDCDSSVELVTHAYCSWLAQVLTPKDNGCVYTQDLRLMYIVGHAYTLCADRTDAYAERRRFCIYTQCVMHIVGDSHTLLCTSTNTARPRFCIHTQCVIHMYSLLYTHCA